MIEKIINVLVIAAMVLVANYPIYANLKDTASEVNGIARDIKSEVFKWRTDVNIVKTKLENVKTEIIGTIDDGITQTNSVMSKTDELLAKIKQLEEDVDQLSTKIETKVEEIKEQPTDAIKDLLKIKG
tara:strand:- start:895 stop:1278 length:384 start_codon:yes stop_codon:yes gene_type:complete